MPHIPGLFEIKLKTIKKLISTQSIPKYQIEIKVDLGVLRFFNKYRPAMKYKNNIVI